MSLTDGIIGCWSPSVRGSGYLLPDLARGNHGTLTNMDAGTDWLGATVQGISGRVLDFDGTNDYVSFGKSPVSGSQARTIVVWAKHNSVASGGVNRIIYSAGNTASAGTQFEFGQNGSLGGAWYFQGYSANANFTTGDTNWHMHAVGYTGTVLQWWVDGVSIGTATLSLNTDGSTHGIGRDIVFAGSFLNGQVGELAIFNRQISVAEINRLYCRGNGAIGRELTGQTRRRVYGFVPAGFRAYWARRQSQIIGGGVR